jgi:Ca2+-binding EF-hand superfamily protein
MNKMERRQRMQKQEPETIWVNVFSKMKDDGQIHHDDLPRALALAGFECPDMRWIDEVYDAITKYSSIGQEEFVRFVRGYAHRQREAYAAAFAKCDEDGSGMVTAGELKNLLRSFGSEPMRHVFAELIREVDQDQSNCLDLAEFEKVMELIRTREGFTKKEYDEFMVVYMRFDRDGSGEIDASELRSALNWLGYAVNNERSQQIVSEVDVDGSGNINEREFLICMRKVREHELSILADTIKQDDPLGDGTLHSDKIESILRTLNYTPDSDAVLECCQEARIKENSRLDISSFWQFLTAYRMSEGFSSSDAHDIEVAFERYDKADCGEITTSEVGKLLRWLGHAVPFQVVQQFIAKVDVDSSGKLSLGELRKMIRMFHEKELRKMRAVFNRHDVNNRGIITKLQMNAALKELDVDTGNQLPAKAVADVFSGGGNVFTRTRTFNDNNIESRQFIHIVKTFRKLARQFFQENCCFSSKELEDLKFVFKSYDVDGGGDIGNRELIQLVEDAFPDVAHDKAMRPKLLEIMEKVDRDNSGSLDFKDFLNLMQLLREAQDDEKVVKEAIAAKATMFSPQEVEGFRELFIESQHGSEYVSFQDVMHLLGSVMPLGDKYADDLYRHVRDVAATKHHMHGEQLHIDFPEFLRLMRKLLDCNFARIKDMTSGYISSGY